MKTKLIKPFLLFASFFMLPVLANAASGDVIVTSLISDAPSVSGTRTIVAGTGCFNDSGNCVKMNCLTGNCTGNDSWSISLSAASTTEITAVWYEKYDVWPLAGSPDNCKSVRPFYGSNSDDYINNLSTAYSDHNVTHGAGIGSWRAETASIVYTPYVTSYFEGYPGYANACVSGGSPGITLWCFNNFNFSFTMDGGITSGMGTAWRKMRLWSKLASDFTATDGAFKLWIDDQLMVTGTNMGLRSTPNTNGTNPPTFHHFMLAPVDESTTPHGHWYDNVTIYDGYVAPNGINTNAPAAPMWLDVI